MNELVVRIAARGDGVTANGRHVPFGVPGDAVLEDGALAFGAHHQEPPCRHFPECGGCQLQHADDAAYRGYLVSRIETALAQHDLRTEIRDPHLSPPRSRRRATLKGMKVAAGGVVGFHAEKSHQIIDMHECHVIRPELFALVQPLRALFANLAKPKQAAEAQLTLIDGGPDVLLRGVSADGLEALQALTDFAGTYRLARLSIDHGGGPEPLYEPIAATITLSGARVAFPPGTFLQPTQDGEAALVECVNQCVGEGRAVADLFAGLGTFALGARATYAAEASRDAAAALRQASAGMSVEHRDLYRRPLDSGELARFGAVILDPPRSGATQQVQQLAASTVERVAYVSCNPGTFSRDARTLVDGGYRLGWIRPVGQFRWSTHVELAACFSR